jgi:hypothetical protein
MQDSARNSGDIQFPDNLKGRQFVPQLASIQEHTSASIPVVNYYPAAPQTMNRSSEKFQRDVQACFIALISAIAAIFV